MTPRIPMDELLERLAQRGLTSPTAARRSLRATLAVLRERLVDDEARALAEVVPRELSDLLEGTYDSDFTAEELFERVRRREHTEGGRAREDAEIVLLALGACLDEDRRRRIARGLPDRAAELLLGKFTAPSAFGEPPPHRYAAANSLAAGQPGSAHPVSESGPPPSPTHTLATGQPGSASSLATGKPGSTHPLSESAPPKRS